MYSILFRGQVICAITGHKDGYIKKFDCIIKGVFSSPEPKAKVSL